MNKNDLPPPRIEFPCPNYPIKVIGDAGEGFAEMVIEVMQRHVTDFDRAVKLLSEEPGYETQPLSPLAKKFNLDVQYVQALQKKWKEFLMNGELQFLLWLWYLVIWVIALQQASAFHVMLEMEKMFLMENI